MSLESKGDTQLVSSCCGAEMFWWLKHISGDGSAHVFQEMYDCTKCYKPCTPVDPSEVRRRSSDKEEKDGA